MRYRVFSSVFLISLIGVTTASFAEPLAITPFQTSNRSPLVQVFGLPAAGSSAILGKGGSEAALLVDIANSYAVDSNHSESVILDGETYRTTVSFRHGVGSRSEAGIEIPFVGNSGGVFDSFIVGWHDFFGLPQGGREEAPRKRLLYSYSRNGSELMRVDRSNTGIGDIRLTGGYQLYRSMDQAPSAVSVRSSLKLPTGDSNRLQGSGSFDAALWFDASDTYGVSAGHLTVFGSVGGMAMTKGDVLPDQQRNLAGFGSLGIGWAPLEWIALILQFSGHTAFYEGSNLKELSSSSLQLHSGGVLRLPGLFLLDIAVSEDVAVDTAPDITLHIGLRRPF